LQYFVVGYLDNTCASFAVDLVYFEVGNLDYTCASFAGYFNGTPVVVYTCQLILRVTPIFNYNLCDFLFMFLGHGEDLFCALSVCHDDAGV
jgi:hypothetical protein